MGKGQDTKEHIIRQSAGLFNTKGYAGTTLSDIIERCQVRKGGIYNHFENKDEIALAAFDYSFAQLRNLLAEAMAAWSTRADKLLAICDVYVTLIEQDVCEGGCPILNTAVENDDGHPLLKQRAQHAMTELMTALGKMIREGIELQEFRSDVDVKAACSVIIALVEGGLMLSKLFDDNIHIRHCTDQVRAYIKGNLAT
ncbi:TetR/AcrR family transcriptional regulator [Paenibacillus sp. LHD-38]|uniref:TetR/AcrR family transcriptional regulator n=1 Tax=Paenibacillus sp. LHD-38 TaxID=3072143 RepID=UPI00280E3C3A|nr:TetR/AcrR family transcriptional regulator [Paenibacillus sp. LHD-38]MDQ8739442.1 TetR/AcrR family transcriptional regulator [Paenibacillus sp. LHD-38]